MHEAQVSKRRTVAGSIPIALDEMLRTLETSIAGLSDTQLWSRPIEGRHSIGDIVLHVLGNVDRHANAQIRQIWCLRGAMGAVDREHFPVQFWH